MLPALHFDMTRSHIPILKPEKKKKQPSRLTRGSRIKPVSATRAKINKIYSALRRAFLFKHPICQWWLLENGWIEEVAPHSEETLYSNHKIGCMRASWGWLAHAYKPLFSSDIHHVCGRGKYLLDTSTWMAVSRKAHDYIHANPKESYERGYMLPRN